MNIELKPCPFCGGNAKVNARQAKFCGQNYIGNKKISWQIYIKCTKCHGRGKPIRTVPIKMNDEETGRYDTGNFWSTIWNGCGNQMATETFSPYVKEAAEAWNRRAK